MQINIAGNVLEVEEIGSGTFAAAFRNGDTVYLNVENCRVRESLGTLDYEVKHIPKIKKIANSWYQMPYYTETGSMLCEKIALDLFKAYYNTCFKNENAFVEWCKVNKPEFYEAFKFLLSIVEIGNGDIIFDFCPHNFSFDKDGTIIFRDILFDDKAKRYDEECDA